VSGSIQVRLLAGVVAEQFVAGAVRLTHHHTLALLPVPVVLTELRVAVAIGVLLAVLHMQQAQRHPDFAQLKVDHLRCRQWRAL
jgi:hypothetical protein